MLDPTRNELEYNLPDRIEVLLVDDDEFDRRIIARTLAKALPNRTGVSEAADLANAKKRIETTEFDFILVDQGLGAHDGLDLIEWLADQETIPVAILITGDESVELESRAIAAGAWQFIPKGELSPGMLRRMMKFAWNQAWQARALERSRQALADQQAFLAATLDAAEAGILTFGSDGRILLANQTARRYLAMSSCDDRWPAQAQLLDSESHKPLPAERHPIQRFNAGDEIPNTDYLLQIPDSRWPRHLQISVQRLSLGDPGIEGVLLLHDVTEFEQNRHRAERAGRLEALGQMTGGIAHDFNNLLATVMASAEVGQLVPDQSVQSLDTILRAAKRGTELTQKLLAFARPAERPKERVYVDEVCRGSVDLVERTLSTEEHGQIQVVKDFDAHNAHIVCSTSEFEHVLLNLLINARDGIRDSQEPGKISLATRQSTQSPNHVEIVVRDDGCGMPEHVRRRATDPFFTTKPLHAGTGLGLSLVASFVDRLKGELEIDSQPDEGTTVRLRLPASITHEVAADEQDRRAVDSQMGLGQTVLIVDDEDDLRTMLGRLLEALNYRVVTAADADAALAMFARDEPIDMMLTDVVMPGIMNGFELADALKQRGIDIPVAFMSGYADVAKPAKDVRYLQKPCNLPKLAALMASLSSDSPQSNSGI